MVFVYHLEFQNLLFWSHDLCLYMILPLLPNFTLIEHYGAETQPKNDFQDCDYLHFVVTLSYCILKLHFNFLTLC